MTSYGSLLFQKRPYSTANKPYQVAISYIPKIRQNPLDPKLYPAGEDNFIHATNSDGHVALGVADGVGGWSNKVGFSAADMSKELCRSIETFYNTSKSISLTPLLRKALYDVKHVKKIPYGGTTVCYGSLDPQKKVLDVLNLGDSWCGVFRNYTCVNQTRVQTLGFNTPAQLSIIPPDLKAQAARQGSHYIENKPEDGDLYQFELQKGDIVLFVTDGVIDNVDTGAIGHYLEKVYEKDTPEFQTVIDKMASGIQVLSLDRNWPSPFSVELSKQTNEQHYGGKNDDITIAAFLIN